MSYHHTESYRQHRMREYRRMVRQLEAGTLPRDIKGDRDVLVAAMETVQRQCDVADDLPRGRW